MSETLRHRSDESPTLGCRENFWGQVSSTGDTEESTAESHSDTGKMDSVGTTKAEYLAHSILKESGTILCPTALKDPANREYPAMFEWLFQDACLLDHDPEAIHKEQQAIEITDPELYIPREFPDGFAPMESGQYRHRRRYNTEHGYVSFGGIIANRPTDEFMEVIDTLLDFVVRRDEIALQESKAKKYRRDAIRMKSKGEMHDVSILETILADVLDEIDG